MARPVNEAYRDEQKRKLNQAILDLQNEGKRVTRMAVADAMGVSRQAVSSGYLGEYLDSLHILSNAQDPISEIAYLEAEIEKWKNKYHREVALRKTREKELLDKIDELDRTIDALSNQIVRIRSERYEHERKNQL